MCGCCINYISWKGNSAVVIGLLPAHFILTYYCIAKYASLIEFLLLKHNPLFRFLHTSECLYDTCSINRSKRLGWILKILVLFSLPVPLILWPIMAIVGSLLVGWDTASSRHFLQLLRLINATTASWMAYLQLLRVAGCFLVCTLDVVVDVPLITAVALWKSPYMLFRGWKRLLEDLIGREGPFLETVCVPFAGLAIILWPLAVLGAGLAAFFSSFFLGLYAGVVVHQED